MSTIEVEMAGDEGRAGLIRAVVVGAVIGFAIAFALTAGGLLLLTTYGTAAALGSGAFVGAFAGVGFGAMMGGSVHHH